MRLLKTNSSKTTFEESLVKFKHLRIRGYPKTIIERFLSGVNFADRTSALTQKKNRSLRGHVLTGNECYAINIVDVIVDMLL